MTCGLKVVPKPHAYGPTLPNHKVLCDGEDEAFRLLKT